MKRLRGKLTYANVISTLCLFLLVAGGTAFAATQLGKNSVGAKQIKKGAVTPSKLSGSAKAAITGARGEAGARGPEGIQGVRGAKGEKGEAGPATTALWAEVSGGSGTLVKSSGTASARRRDTGEFEVVFDRDVSTCSYQVTMASTAGEALVEPKTANADAVYVETFNSAGTLQDKTFYLAIFC